MVRIAVCSRNGIAVDEHFSRTTCFYIYDVGRNTIGLASMRLAPASGEGYDLERLRLVRNLLHDCEFVFAFMIAPELRRWFEDNSMTVITGERGVPELIGAIKELKKKELSHA